MVLERGKVLFWVEMGKYGWHVNKRRYCRRKVKNMRQDLETGINTKCS